MKVSNPRVTRDNTSSVYPFRLVADVEDVTTILKLYPTRPIRETWENDYGMWISGFRAAASLLFYTQIEEIH